MQPVYVLSTRRYLPTRLHAAITHEIRILLTCLLKVRIAKPEERAIDRQWLCKHVSRVTKSRERRNRYENETIKELLEAVFSDESSPRLRKEASRSIQIRN
jgi:hypothetical protein